MFPGACGFRLSPAPKRGSCSVSVGSGFRVQGSGFRVQGSRFRVQGSGFRVRGSGFGDQRQGEGWQARARERGLLFLPRLRFQVSGFRVQVQGSGFRVQGFGFRVHRVLSVDQKVTRNGSIARERDLPGWRV